MAPAVVFVTEHLKADHAALPVRRAAAWRSALYLGLRSRRRRLARYRGGGKVTFGIAFAARRDVVLEGPQEAAPAKVPLHAPERALEHIAHLAGLQMPGVPDPLPRARVVTGARVIDGTLGLATILDPGFDPTREVPLAEGAPTPSSSVPPGSVRITKERADRIVLEAELQEAGFVVLADAYDPGWRVTLDVPMLRANLAFRAVSAPAGRHRIEMVYRPRTLWAGVVVSAAALLALLALVVRHPAR